MNEVPSELDLLLVGGGHSHVSVLRRLAMGAWPGVRVTLVTRDVHTPYSGMLPGHIAGHYDQDDVHIDLGPLAQAAGARLIHDEIVALDPAQRRLSFAARPPLRFDLLSLNTGSTPDLGPAGTGSERVLPVKPISSFLPRCAALLQRVRDTAAPMDIAVVGAGAGGLELTLALAVRLEQEGLGDRARLHLVCADAGPLPAARASVRAHFERALAARGVSVHRHFRVARVEAQDLVASDEARLPAAEVLWVTQAAPPHWLRSSGLALDEAGFIAVGPTLQSRSHDAVFAAGDIASLTHAPRPRSGVYAVRAGPVLADNLQAWISGGRLRPYRPQRHALYLVTTGDRNAVVLRPGVPALAGAWVWRWKDWIDRRFMRRFSQLPDMTGGEPASMVAPSRGGGSAGSGMRCTGCGSKLGLDTLLTGLGAAGGSDAGMDGPAVTSAGFEDTARLSIGGADIEQTMDGFPLPLADLWLSARIATVHALGDIHAMGGRPRGALVLAMVQYAGAALMAQDLAQLMAGVRHELTSHGCRLLGGHSCEGREAVLALAVTGDVEPSQEALAKGGGRAGDVLVLTKALGTGVVLAASSEARLPSRDRDAAIAHMLVSNAAAVAVLRDHEVHGCTDVTGFGLLGHALEMADAADLALELEAGAAAPLPGALEALGQGAQSSLQDDNEAGFERVTLLGLTRAAASVRLLADPQTCGGLLAAVPAARARECVDKLRAAGFAGAACVGRLSAVEPGATRHRVVAAGGGANDSVPGV